MCCLLEKPRPPSFRVQMKYDQTLSCHSRTFPETELEIKAGLVQGVWGSKVRHETWDSMESGGSSVTWGCGQKLRKQTPIKRDMVIKSRGQQQARNQIGFGAADTWHLGSEVTGLTLESLLTEHQRNESRADADLPPPRGVRICSEGASRHGANRQVPWTQPGAVIPYAASCQMRF